MNRWTLKFVIVIPILLSYRDNYNGFATIQIIFANEQCPKMKWVISFQPVFDNEMKVRYAGT